MEGAETQKKEQDIDYSDTFLRYLLTLQSGALIALGKIKNPVTEQVEISNKEAREIINILSMLRQKTAGNLSQMEQKVITNMLANLQLDYVSTFIAGEKKDV